MAYRSVRHKSIKVDVRHLAYTGIMIINNGLWYLDGKIKIITRRLKKEILIPCLLLAFFLVTSRVYAFDYELAWPGILPDHPLYKVKVLRNKIIERMIIHPSKKVEFHLLMSDKTIYASKLMFEKGNIPLAKDTALKGENYYSMLVQDYNQTLLANENIPMWLDKKITRAAIKHQEIFQELQGKAEDSDKETFQIVHKFSVINYGFIEELRDHKGRK